MKTYTDLGDLLKDTNHGKMTVILPHEKCLEDIRTHHSEIYRGLRALSLKTPKGGVHSTMVQAKNKAAYELLTDTLKAAEVKYSLLGPKGNPMPPELSAS